MSLLDAYIRLAGGGREEFMKSAELAALVRLQPVEVHPLVRLQGKPPPDAITVGPEDGKNIVLQSHDAALSHVYIRKRHEDWSIVLESSKSETFLRGMSLEPGKEYPLESGDSIRFGEIAMTFYIARDLYGWIRAQNSSDDNEGDTRESLIAPAKAPPLAAAKQLDEKSTPREVSNAPRAMTLRELLMALRQGARNLYGWIRAQESSDANEGEVPNAPRATTLLELLMELRQGYALYKPIIIELEPKRGSTTSYEGTAPKENISRQNWTEAYSREYGKHSFIVLGTNELSRLVAYVTIGRSRRCDVRIDHDSVSKVHASIGFNRESGEFYVIDEHSRNGTQINGEPLKPGVPQPIWSGAYVSFGDAEFVFLDPPTLRRMATLAV